MIWHRKRVEPPAYVTAEGRGLAGAKAEAEQAHRAAEYQAAQAENVVEKLARTRLRNGFAPAIEASILRRLEET